MNTVTSVRAFLLLGYGEFMFFRQSRVLQFRRNMKTATVRELRNRYTQLLKWLEAEEEIRITRRRHRPFGAREPRQSSARSQLDQERSLCPGPAKPASLNS